MTAQQANEPGTSTGTRSPEEIRAELLRMIDEIGTSRSQSPSKLRERFDELWSQLGPDSEPAAH